MALFHRRQLIASFSVVGLMSGLAMALGSCSAIGEFDDGQLATRPVPVDGGAAAAMLNTYRVENGLEPLQLDPRLNQASQELANIIAARGDLKTPEHNARRLARRLDRLGYDNLAAAENIGGGYRDLAHVMQGWRGSPGHDKNLKNPHVTRFGIARADSQGGTWTQYWAMILALPREDYTPPPGMMLR